MKAGLFVTSIFIAACASAGCVGEAPERALTSSSGNNDALPAAGDLSTGNDVAPKTAADAAAAPPSKAAACSRSFGNVLRVEYGRLDGVVSAVVKPTDTQCTQPLADRVVIEVAMSGAIYRMLVETEYMNPPMGTDPRVRYLAYDSAFTPHGNWFEGWHENYNLDYSATLGIRAGMFNPVESADLVEKVVEEIRIGDKISVYTHANSSSSGEYIRRQGGGQDGAVMLRGDTGTPRILAFYFDGQMF